MIRKGQIRWVAGDDLPRQIKFIDHLFDLAASTQVGACNNLSAPEGCNTAIAVQNSNDQ
jgi:hypothetical protein